MRALVLHGAGQLTVEQVPDACLPDSRGAVVKVLRTAICGSDLHLFHGMAAGFPLRPGHELVGEVVEVGSDVRRFVVGDVVLVAAVIGCDACTGCLRGDVVACVNGGPRVFGTTPLLAGAQAEWIAVPAADTSLLRLPDGITPDQGLMLTDILPTGWFGAQLADVRPGSDVAVIGLGPVGLAAVMSSLTMGAARVFAVDPVPERRARAAALGAISVDPAGDPLRALTGGRGVDAVIEAVGRRSSIRAALDAVRVGGSVGVVGAGHDNAFPFPMVEMFLKNITFRTGLCPVASTWAQLVPLVAAGTLAPESMLSHVFPLSQGPAAYALCDSRSDNVMKVVLDPSA